MINTRYIAISVLFVTFVTGCISLPQQKAKDINSEKLVGTWKSMSFDGLMANDYSSETFTFNQDSTFHEETKFAKGVETQFNGTYKIAGRKIVLDSGKGNVATVPLYLKEDTLIITRRAGIGRVKVTFERVN